MPPPSPAAPRRTTTVTLDRARSRVDRSCNGAARLVGVFGACGVATVVYAASLPSPAAAAAHKIPLTLSALLLGAQLMRLAASLRGDGGDTPRAVWTSRLDGVTVRLYEAASCLGGLLVIAVTRTQSVLGRATLPHCQCAAGALIIGGPLILAVRTMTAEPEDVLRGERAPGEP